MRCCRCTRKLKPFKMSRVSNAQRMPQMSETCINLARAQAIYVPIVKLRLVDVIAMHKSLLATSIQLCCVRPYVIWLSCKGIFYMPRGNELVKWALRQAISNIRLLIRLLQHSMSTDKSRSTRTVLRLAHLRG